MVDVLGRKCICTRIIIPHAFTEHVKSVKTCWSSEAKCTDTALVESESSEGHVGYEMTARVIQKRCMSKGAQ